MRRIPSFILCAITMVLFIGPALLSVGIPAPTPSSRTERQGEDRTSADSVLCQVPSFAFDVSKPGAPGWRLAGSEATPNLHRVRLIRDASENTKAVEVTIDAHRSDAAGPLTAEDVERIEDSLAGNSAAYSSFGNKVCRFAGHDGVQIEANATDFIVGTTDASVTARAIRHRQAVIVVTARVGDSSTATARAALDEIESSLRFH